MKRRALAVALLAVLCLLVPLRAAGDATAAATRAAIDGVLEAMEKAVLAGDADAYLLHICGEDAVFLQEQRMWAADLKRHVPDVFDLRIIDPAERKANERASGAPEKDEAAMAADAADYPHEFTVDRAVFELEMSWKITVPLADGEEGEADRLDRSVSYPVVFERKGDRWLFKGERWVEVRLPANPPAAAVAIVDPDSEHTAQPSKSEDLLPTPPPNAAASTRDNIALCFPGFEEVALQIVEVLPEVRAHVDAGFGGDVPHPQVVKIYPTERHLQASIYLSYVDGLSGWNEPKESIKVIVHRSNSRTALRSLLAHEYGHVATFEMGPNATDIAWWAIEGLAELSAEGFRRNAMRRVNDRVQKWAADDALAPFASITDFRNTPKQFMNRVYTQGHHMVAYINERFGREKLNGWFRAMANGASIDDATRSVLDESGGFGELDTQWRAELARDAAAEEAQ